MWLPSNDKFLGIVWLILSKFIKDTESNKQQNLFGLHVSIHFELACTTDISRDYSMRLSKRLVDSDLAVIGLTGIGLIRKISVLDWFLT